MRLALAAVGFTSTIAQLVLLRELVATFYGNELLYGLALMAWLAGVAAGARGSARLLDRERRSERFTEEISLVQVCGKNGKNQRIFSPHYMRSINIF